MSPAPDQFPTAQSAPALSRGLARRTASAADFPRTSLDVVPTLVSQARKQIIQIDLFQNISTLSSPSPAPATAWQSPPPPTIGPPNSITCLTSPPLRLTSLLLISLSNLLSVLVIPSAPNLQPLVLLSADNSYKPPCPMSCWRQAQPTPATGPKTSPVSSQLTMPTISDPSACPASFSTRTPIMLYETASGNALKLPMLSRFSPRSSSLSKILSGSARVPSLSLPALQYQYNGAPDLANLSSASYMPKYRPQVQGSKLRAIVAASY